MQILKENGINWQEKKIDQQTANGFEFTIGTKGDKKRHDYKRS